MHRFFSRLKLERNVWYRLTCFLRFIHFFIPETIWISLQFHISFGPTFDVNCTCLVHWLLIAITFFLSLILPLNFSYLIAKVPWYHRNFIDNKMVIIPTFTIVVLKFIDCVEGIGAPVTQLLASQTRRICVYFITLHDKSQYSVLFNSAFKTDFGRSVIMVEQVLICTWIHKNCKKWHASFFLCLNTYVMFFRFVLCLFVGVVCRVSHGYEWCLFIVLPVAEVFCGT